MSLATRRDETWLSTTARQQGGQSSCLVEQFLKKKLPNVFQYRDYVEAGGLMSYGPDRRQFYVRTAEYVDKILKVRSPATCQSSSPPNSNS